MGRDRGANAPRRGRSGTLLLPALLLPALLLSACLPAEPEPPPTPPPAPCSLSDGGDGVDAPLASGPTFLADHFGLAQPGHGLDLDGDGSIDEAFNEVFRMVLGPFNARIRERMETGWYLFAAELAGLCQPFAGNDPAISARSYYCEDPDDDNTNNFCLDDDCAGLWIDTQRLVEGSPPLHTDPAPIQDYQITAPMAGVVVFPLVDPATLTVRHAWISSVASADLQEVTGVIAGVMVLHDLQQVPFDPCLLDPNLCEEPDPDPLSAAEYLRLLGHCPDVDVDGDGLECFGLDHANHVLDCTDGDGTLIPGPDCLADPAMQDGYSGTLEFHGRRVKLSLP